MGSNTETPTQVAYPKQSLCLHQFQTISGERVKHPRRLDHIQEDPPRLERSTTGSLLEARPRTFKKNENQSQRLTQVLSKRVQTTPTFHDVWRWIFWEEFQHL